MSDLNTFLKPDAGTPVEATEQISTETPLSLDDAFSSLVKGWENEQNGTAKPDTNVSPVPAKDTSKPEDDANSQSQNETQDAATAGTGATNTPQIDEAQALREKLIADKDAQINLYKSRLHELSNQYNQLKNVSQHLYESTTQISKAEDVPSKVKELRELYPDIAEAMEAYIEHKVGNPALIADQIATEKAALVAQQVQAIQQQQHMNAILSRHPDLQEVMHSSDAKQWFESLDPVAKRGAQYVLNYGTADDVNILLDQYKNSRAAGTTNQPQNSAGVNNLASRVVNAMGVKSNKPEPAPVANQEKTERPLTQQEIFERLAREYEKDPTSLR